MNFNKEQANRIEYIETVIKNYLPKEEGFQKTIFEAMNYSVLGGGKRIRPMLMLETYRLFGGADQSYIEPFIAAIEMIHSYSLVHDDLPAMDNDEYRRGRKTTHIVYGEAMGILAGDGLLNYAFETACKAFKVNSAERDSTVLYERIRKAAKAMEILGQKAGVYGMIGGQVVDIEGIHHEDSPLEKLNCVYKLKTSALIEASMMIGAILVGANDAEAAIVEDMAANIGLAFQIQDDILDVTSTVEVLGKPVHSDERNEKITYVTLLGIDKAKEQVEELTQKALAGFDSLNRKNEYLKELINRLITRIK
ncbi:polyprenyl synthetase family protein [Anaerocolumna aminovalerica]|uniref:polyprenyl synthetase family protein n=1 Tax=Anaerocolumna aminovalerica TaxID=1527 RepID=UPI001C0ED878|nr:farnesyl diphosphate synthase [Anaerocolumna aminovalerica]MBU5332045.1 polyprenyl synthetase family protein [Anaerocolumna aminovalerica]